MTALVVDTSAIVAILRDDPEKDRFVDMILRADARFMLAVSMREAGMVVLGSMATRPRGSRWMRY